MEPPSYMVTPAKKGFTGNLDIVNAQWFTPFDKQGSSMTFTQHDKVNEAKRTYTVVDDSVRCHSR